MLRSQIFGSIQIMNHNISLYFTFACIENSFRTICLTSQSNPSQHLHLGPRGGASNRALCYMFIQSITSTALSPLQSMLNSKLEDRVLGYTIIYFGSFLQKETEILSGNNNSKISN